MAPTGNSDFQNAVPGNAVGNYGVMSNAVGHAGTYIQDHAQIDSVVSFPHALSLQTSSACSSDLEIYGAALSSGAARASSDDSCDDVSKASPSADENIEQGGSELSFTSSEKFELLSAYLDDEVTEEERALVDHWLASDPDIKEQYQKQCRLRDAIRAMLS